MRSLFVSLLTPAFLVFAACDPQGPGAAGQITAPTAASFGFTKLELAFFPDLDGRFELAGPPALPTNKSEYVLYDSVEMSAIAFPYAYSIGKGVGTSEYVTWRIVAWLANPETERWPDGSEPFATAEVAISACDGLDGYCGVTDGIDLALASPAPGP